MARFITWPQTYRSNFFYATSAWRDGSSRLALRLSSNNKKDDRMDIEKLHPEFQSVYKRIPSVPFHSRLFLKLLEVAQKLRPMRSVIKDSFTIVNRPLSHGSVRVYQQKNTTPRGALLWIHGGGYVMGNAATNDRECIRYMEEAGVIVFSVDYRLAPKYPFPLPLDDCFNAWQFIVTNAQEFGIDPQNIAIAGQSAGGGLAAGLCQRIRDLGGIQPVCQVLYYPMMDDRTGANKGLDAIAHRLWNNKSNRAGWGFYLGQPAGTKDLPPYAAPARCENLSGLPPVWLGVGTLDLFYEEDKLYVERLKQAGVPCEYLEVDAAPHGFDLLVPDAELSKHTWAHQLEFLKKHWVC